MGKSPDELASYVRILYDQFINNCLAAGCPVIIEDTGRLPSEQVLNIQMGRSWTRNSKHLPQPPEMKSEAFDAVPRSVVNLKQWGWTGDYEHSHPDWAKMRDIGERLGLRCGGRWPYNPPHSKPDPGHFQWQQPQSASDEDVSTA